MTCVILYNMIIESERVDLPQQDDHPYYHQGPLTQIDHEYGDLTTDFVTFLIINAEIKDEGAYE